MTWVLLVTLWNQSPVPATLVTYPTLEACELTKAWFEKTAIVARYRCHLEAGKPQKY